MWSSSVCGARLESFGTGIHIQTLLCFPARVAEKKASTMLSTDVGACSLLNLRVLELLILWVPRGPPAGVGERKSAACSYLPESSGSFFYLM